MEQDPNEDAFDSGFFGHPSRADALNTPKNDTVQKWDEMKESEFNRHVDNDEEGNITASIIENGPMVRESVAESVDQYDAEYMSEEKKET